MEFISSHISYYITIYYIKKFLLVFICITLLAILDLKVENTCVKVTVPLVKV